MRTTTFALAAVAAAIHVLIFVIESLVFMRPAVHKRFLIETIEQARSQRLIFFNQGFYNLFLAIGCAVGILLASGHDRGDRWALLSFTLLCMVAAAAVLISANRRMIRAAAVQGIPPALALAAMLAA